MTYANVYKDKEPIIVAAPVSDSGIQALQMRAYYQTDRDPAMIKADYDVFQNEAAALVEAGGRFRECQKP